MLDKHLNAAKNRRDPLVVRTKHNNPWMTSGWIRTHVAKAAVERDQHPTLRPRRFEHSRIVASAEGFLKHRIDIEEKLAQELRDSRRDVFVELSFNDRLRAGAVPRARALRRKTLRRAPPRSSATDTA